METITVVAAIIVNNQQILCVQRPRSKYSYISEKYEFPGGKIEQGETEEEALSREIHEELLLDIQISNKFLTVEHSYPDFTLQMHAYLCKCNTRNIELQEHISLKWLARNKLISLDWAAADVPVVQKLMHRA